MLLVPIPSREWYDEARNLFVSHPATVLKLEHSLISISKWEAKWKEPYFGIGKVDHTVEQKIDYVRCMTINTQVDPLVYGSITPDILKTIIDYINDPMTATTIRSDRKEGQSRYRGNAITSEYIYSLMVELNIPWEAEKWHYNRLMMLIRVLQERQKEHKPMSQRELAKRNSALNAARHAKHAKGKKR